MTTQDVELEQLVKYLPQRGQLEALQVFLKNGIIEPQGDSSFYDFMVPLALTAVRTELQNLIVVTDLLTEWLQGLRMTSEITPVWEQKAAAAGSGAPGAGGLCSRKRGCDPGGSAAKDCSLYP